MPVTIYSRPFANNRLSASADAYDLWVNKKTLRIGGSKLIAAVVFFGLLALGLLLVGVGAQSPIVSYASEDCLALSVSGPLGKLGCIKLLGEYAVYDGACPGNTGSAAYYDGAREIFLYMQSGKWTVNDMCGENVENVENSDWF